VQVDVVSCCMKLRKSEYWVLWYEGGGFALIILAVWLDHFSGLTRLLFGGEPLAGEWHKSAAVSALVLVVGTAVIWLTKRLLGHLLYLEGFLRVCAWCRKVGYKDQWIGLEEYFQQGFRVGTTHGVCPECMKKVEEDAEQFRLSLEAKAVQSILEPEQPQPSPAG
jgi:hypothetical protein